MPLFRYGKYESEETKVFLCDFVYFVDECIAGQGIRLPDGLDRIYEWRDKNGDCNA